MLDVQRKPAKAKGAFFFEGLGGLNWGGGGGKIPPGSSGAAPIEMGPLNSVSFAF